MSCTANSRRLAVTILRKFPASPPIPTACRARRRARAAAPPSRTPGCGRAQQIGAGAEQGLEAVEVGGDGIDAAGLQREFEQSGRVATCHAGYDRVFALHVASRASSQERRQRRGGAPKALRFQRNSAEGREKAEPNPSSRRVISMPAPGLQHDGVPKNSTRSQAIGRMRGGVSFRPQLEQRRGADRSPVVRGEAKPEPGTDRRKSVSGSRFRVARQMPASCRLSGMTGSELVVPNGARRRAGTVCRVGRLFLRAVPARAPLALGRDDEGRSAAPARRPNRHTKLCGSTSTASVTLPRGGATFASHSLR